MGISVRKEDPGFNPYASECFVYLDGKKLNNCFTADEEKGEAHCYAWDENGGLVIDPRDPGKIKEEILYGDVKVVVPEGFTEID